MEQETPGSDNTSNLDPQFTGEEFKSSAELIFQEYELPDLLEFSALDNIFDKPCEGSDLGFISTRQQSISTPSLQQDARPIFAAVQELDIEQEDPTRFQFVCRVCEKSFKTIRACERHIIRSGHTYPLIALRSSDMMNGELDSFVAPDSMEDRGTYSSSKTLPSPHLLPVYLGKWSKDPDCENGVFLNHNHHQNSVGRFSQPDVTQTEPKAPHAELARTMEKLNECFQTKSVPGIETSNMNGLLEQPNSVDESVPDVAAEEQPNDSKVEDEVDKLHESDGQLVDTSNASDLPQKTNEGELGSVPKNASLQKNSDATLVPSQHQDLADHPVHKIYVDFNANELFCEGCGIVFYTLNDAANHWKNAKPGDFGEPSEDVVDGAIRCAARKKTMGSPEDSAKKSFEVVTLEKCSPSDLNKKADAGGDEQVPNDEAPNNTGSGEAPDQGNDDSADKPNDIPGDNSTGKFFGLSPFSGKQNDGAVFDSGEKELLITDDARWGKRGSSIRRSRRKRKKNKPLKYIRRAVMLTLTFLF